LAFSAVVSACGLSASQQVDQAQLVAVEEAWGIRVLHVSLTAGGSMIDLRYQVTNPEKAALALGGGSHGASDYEEAIEALKESPLLIDEASGYALTETHLHLGGRVQKQRLEPQAGLTRFILFSNTGGLIERGSKVSLAIGDSDLRLEHLAVQ
jgi:hypothetical protein